MGTSLIKTGKIKISFMGILQYLSLYLMFICHDAALYRENTMVYRIAIVLFSLLMIVLVKKLRTLPRDIIIFLFAVSGYLLVLGERNLLLNYLECILITYVTYTIDKNKFCERFVKLCMFFLVFSLFFYVMGVIAPDVLLQIYNRENGVIWANSYGWQYYMRGRFLYVVRISELKRNNSIFTEPGIWQMLLNSALFMLLFMQDEFSNIKNKKKILWIVLIVITTLTTVSTTGYIALALIVGFYLISNRKMRSFSDDKKSKKSILRIILIIVAIGCAVLTVDAIKNFQESFLYQKVFLKILESTSDGTSGHARYSMILICLNLAMTHVFGVGEDYLSKLILTTDEGANGAILIHSFASIGLIPVIMIISFYYGRLFKKKVPKMVAVLLILIYLNTVLAQSRLLYPALIMLPIVYSDYCYKKMAIRRLK